MLQRLKANRLKIASVCSISGDFLMGVAGAVGLFHFQDIGHFPDLALLLAGIVAMFGHACVLFWGKGGRGGQRGAGVRKAHSPLWLRPLLAWRYPLDCGFFCFLLAGVGYHVSGLASGNYPLAVVGVLVAAASAIGWLWPQEKTMGGFHVMQVCAILYAGSTAFNFMAGFMAGSVAIIAASVCFTGTNIIYYTVRKENQSSFTQSHEQT